MQIAITGGTGFIGRHLAAYHLRRGDTVRVLTRRATGMAGLPAEVETITGDLAAPDERLARFCDGVDILYHCAGQILDESLMRRLHVDGTRALLAAARGHVDRWVQLSSIGVYGTPRRGVVTESSPLSPVGPYETSKLEADRLLTDAQSPWPFSWSILRPSIVFGPDMPNNSLRQMIRTIRRGLFVCIGAPEASANYVHVNDVVAALWLCGSKAEAQSRVYNLSDDLLVETFVDLICDGLGKTRPHMRCPLGIAKLLAWSAGWIPGFPLTMSRVRALTSRVSYPITRLESDLGFRYEMGTRHGLADAVTVWMGGESERQEQAQ